MAKNTKTYTEELLQIVQSLAKSEGVFLWQPKE